MLRADTQEAINKALLLLPVNLRAATAEDRFLKKGQALLREADALAQFFDRDTSEDLATIAMKGFQEFMIDPYERSAAGPIQSYLPGYLVDGARAAQPVRLVVAVPARAHPADPARARRSAVRAVRRLSDRREHPSVAVRLGRRRAERLGRACQFHRAVRRTAGWQAR